MLAILGNTRGTVLTSFPPMAHNECGSFSKTTTPKEGPASIANLMQ